MIMRNFPFVLLLVIMSNALLGPNVHVLPTMTVAAFSFPSARLSTSCAWNQHYQHYHITQITDNKTIKSSSTTTKTKSRRGNTALSISPSGIDQLPELVQASIFFGYYGLLGATVFPTIKAIDAVSKNAIGLETWRNSFVDTFLPLVLGVLYVSAGVGHFVAASDFRDIYPPYGTWGIWYLPGSAQFHVTWTGIFEFLGGGGLLWTSVMRRNTEDNDDDDDDDDENNNWSFQLVQPISAAVLFVLTILVTPANIYMYTHGATMGGAEALDLSFHYFRFGMQILLLSLLFVLAKDSFFFAWGDELD